MRICVSHQTTYRYQTPASSVIQMLRLTPRNHEGQYIVRWRIDVSSDCHLDQHEDAFGNISHAFTAEGPFSELTVLVDGEVETRDTQGVVRGTVERFPPSLYLRETPLTMPDAKLTSFAGAVKDAAGGGALAVLHLMLDRLHAELDHDTDPAHVATTAAEAFARQGGIGQDLTHIFIAAARSIGIPARYIGGYVRRAGDSAEPDTAKPDTAHAWAEAFVPDLGWVAFDIANGNCPTDTHVRVAVGLDHLGAAPVRGMRYGGGGETLAVNLRVEQAAWQTQN